MKIYAYAKSPSTSTDISDICCISDGASNPPFGKDCFHVSPVASVRQIDVANMILRSFRKCVLRSPLIAAQVTFQQETLFKVS